MMEMSAELTAAVLENILRHGKFNIPTKNAMENAVRILKETPEVVRCEDCKYSRKTVIPYLQNEEKWCNRLEINRPFDWFCADGVKK